MMKENNSSPSSQDHYHRDNSQVKLPLRRESTQGESSNTNSISKSRPTTAESIRTTTSEKSNSIQNSTIICLDDGTGRNVIYYDLKTSTKSRFPPDGFVEETLDHGKKRFYYRGQCIRCRAQSPSVYFTIEHGHYGIATNYCENCLITVTPGINSIRNHGDSIWKENFDIPCHCFVNLRNNLFTEDREEELIRRAQEASFHVKTLAKHFRNLDRLKRMKIIALQQDIYQGKMLSWGFGKEFDEYYGPVDANNRPDGERGIKIYSDGSIYIGGWLKGLRHHVEGIAVWTRPDGCQYEGTWMNDLKHGKGRQRYPDGGLYIGEFAQGFEHGHGVRTYPDNTKYEGRFRFGKRDGPGMMIQPNGTVEKGVFKDTESFHETLIPKVQEVDEIDGTTIIFQPESLLQLAVKAVGNTMKIKRSLLPNLRVDQRLQPFLKPLVARDYLSILRPFGSKGFMEHAPEIAFRQQPTVALNYVKFIQFDMESFLYFTTMNKLLRKLELINNRIDPNSIDMINKQIAAKIWPQLEILDFSFNRIDSTGISTLMTALKQGTPLLRVLKLAGCNISSTGAISIAKYLEDNTTVDELDLSFNTIQVAGTEAIAKALMINNTLTSLNLRQNSIGVIGGESLVKAMQHNFQIRILCVADNKISRDNAVAIAGRLRGSTKDVIQSFRADQLNIPAIHKEKIKREYH